MYNCFCCVFFFKKVIQNKRNCEKEKKSNRKKIINYDPYIYSKKSVISVCPLSADFVVPEVQDGRFQSVSNIYYCYFYFSVYFLKVIEINSE